MVLVIDSWCTDGYEYIVRRRRARSRRRASFRLEAYHSSFEGPGGQSAESHLFFHTDPRDGSLNVKLVHQLGRLRFVNLGRVVLPFSIYEARTSVCLAAAPSEL